MSNTINDETTRLVNSNHLGNDIIPNRSNSNSQPIPANRLALDAQIQAAAEYQRRLRRRRSIYYIVLITSVTMTIFFILSIVALVIHNSSGKSASVQAQSLMIETAQVMDGFPNHVGSLNHFNARKNPTRTIKIKENPSAAVQRLIKRSEMESDEEKDGDLKMNSGKRVIGSRPTRTRKLSFAPEKVIDYKANI